MLHCTQEIYAFLSILAYYRIDGLKFGCKSVIFSNTKETWYISTRYLLLLLFLFPSVLQPLKELRHRTPMLWNQKSRLTTL